MATEPLPRRKAAGNPNETKTCKSCRQDLPASEFYRISGRYLSSACKECTKAGVRAYRAQRSEHYREYDRQRAMDPHRVAARERYRATEAGKAAVARAHRAYHEREPDARTARNVLNNAVRGRKVLKPSTCQVCGGVGRIEAHHDDYSKPLDVRWLCNACHRSQHGRAVS